MVVGVSTDLNPSPSSQVDQDLALAYQGGSSFMARLQALSDSKAEYDLSKARHDASLAELNLGMSAKARMPKRSDCVRMRKTSSQRFSR